MREEQRVLRRLGVEPELLDSGCCGMAGSFGFERGDRYEVATKEGERVLLPRVRQAPDETVVLADGFSCRTQIEQGSERRALHLAELMRLGLRGARTVTAGADRPEAANLALQASDGLRQRRRR
jgi:Fe-S oxidoreductase